MRLYLLVYYACAMTKSKKIHKKTGGRKYIIISFIALIVLVLAALGWFYLQQNKKSSEDTHAADIVRASDVSAVVVNGRQYMDSKDVKAGMVYYDDKIQHAEDDVVKRQLLIAKVDYLLRTGDGAAAAVEIAKDVVDAYGGESEAHAALARAYDANGQKQEAIAEYKQALAMLKGDQPPSRTNPRLIYETKIKELES